jgi:hypothetical protein
MCSSHCVRLWHGRRTPGSDALLRVGGGISTVFLLLALLVSVGGLALPPAVEAASAVGEAAAFLPDDTEMYFGVNLDPAPDQASLFWAISDNWWHNLDLREKLDELLESSGQDYGDIQQDVLPWLGPEIALGMRDTGEYDPQAVILVGTMDTERSTEYVFDTLFPYLAEEQGIPSAEVPSEAEDSYEGVPVVYQFPGYDNYWAFPDGYIVLSSHLSYLEDTLDLMVEPNMARSLAGTDDYKAARAAVPEGVALGYWDIHSYWQDVQDRQAPHWVDKVEDYMPSWVAASLSFSGFGFSLSVACDTPDDTPGGMATTQALSAAAVPEDALYFISGQDLSADWEDFKDQAEADWEDVVADIDEWDLPDDMTMDDIESLDSCLEWFEDETDIDLDADVFSWMNGEWSLAQIAPEVEPGSTVRSEALFFVEVADTEAVDTKLEAIVDACCETAGADTQYPLDSEYIGGIEAHVMSADLRDELELDDDIAPPGWLFLDVGGKHFLVIGVSTDALEAAVEVIQGNEDALADAEAYQQILSDLPGDKGLLAYFNVSSRMNTALEIEKQREMDRVQSAVEWLMEDNDLDTIQGVQTPTNDMSTFPDVESLHGTAGCGWSLYCCDRDGDGEYSYGGYYSGGQYYGDRTYLHRSSTDWSYTCDDEGNVTQHDNEETGLIMECIPTDGAIGFAVSQSESGAVSATGAAYLMPPPLVVQAIAEGTTGSVTIEEQAFDFGHLDSAVGECAASINFELASGADEGASVEMTAMKQIIPDLVAQFGLAASEEGLGVLDLAYVIRVDKTGLEEGDIEGGTITMKVGRAWAEAHAGDQVAILRVSEGVYEVLPTEFLGYDGDTAIYEGTLTGGFSCFALAAVAGGGINWALVGGIVGGVIAVSLVSVAGLRRRRRAAAIWSAP